MATKMLSYDRMERFLGLPDGAAGGDNRREMAAVRRMLPMALDRELTPRQRECVELYYFRGMTEEQAARCLGLSKPTVCRHLQKARARLERVLRYTLQAAREQEE